MPTKEEAVKYLEGRKQSLGSLISILKNAGESHPQYHMLKEFEFKYDIVTDQLSKLQR